MFNFNSTKHFVIQNSVFRALSIQSSIFNEGTWSFIVNAIKTWNSCGLILSSGSSDGESSSYVVLFIFVFLFPSFWRLSERKF